MKPIKAPPLKFPITKDEAYEAIHILENIEVGEYEGHNAGMCIRDIKAYIEKLELAAAYTQVQALMIESKIDVLLRRAGIDPNTIGEKEKS